MRVFDINDFFWDEETLTLVAEASDINYTSASLHYVFDNEMGIQIKGITRNVRFYLAEVVRREGEIQYWRFAPIDDAGRAVALQIFND